MSIVSLQVPEICYYIPMIDFSQKQTFVLTGRSGCGKGTQADLLKEYLHKHDPDTPGMYVETGERFRNFIKGDSYAQRLSYAIYEQDARQPDFLAVWMWSHILVEELKGSEHLIIDGTPRSLAEAEILDTALDFFLRKSVYVIHPNISREEAERRLSERKRGDDDGEGVKKRLDWFESDVAPALDYYRSHPVRNFVEVNGEQSIEKVHEDIVTAL